MAGVDVLDSSLHDLYEEPANVSAVVDLDPDESGQSGVYCQPLFVAALSAGSSVVGDEVGSVVVSVDDEQPGCSEPMAQLAAVDASAHRFDEEGDDVSTVVGVVSDELWYVHWLECPQIDYMF